MEKKSGNEKRRSHIPAIINGDLEKLLEDIPNCPHEPVNWSEKARIYNIHGASSDTLPSDR